VAVLLLLVAKLMPEAVSLLLLLPADAHGCSPGPPQHRSNPKGSSALLELLLAGAVPLLCCCCLGSSACLQAAAAP
jgi:hypothetical protein